MEAFNDIFEDCTSQGTKIPKDEYLSKGKNIVIDQGQNIIAGYTDLEEGLYEDVPAIVFGDHTRIIKYVDKPFFLGADGVKLLKSKKKDANYKYLYYALRNAKIPDTGYNRHFKWLKEVEIEYPDSERQAEIANILDGITRIIEDQEKELKKLDDLIKARFVEMFGRMPQNEKDWEIVTIRDIVQDVRYGSSRKASEDGRYPYLRMNNITDNGELDLTDIKRIDIPDNELDKCSVRCGDVLFNRTNSKEHVGKTCVYNRNEMMVLAGFVVRVRVNDRVIPEFLSAFLNTDFSKALLLNMCKAAIGQANINAQELQNIDIYIPPIDLQQSFLMFKQQVDKSKVDVQAALDKTQLLFDSLMQKYFG